MRTTRGYERLTFFSDAVVAIALTLLILPLVDLVSQGQHHVTTLWTQDHNQVIAFLISFWVIGRLWLAFHKIGEYLDGYDSTLAALTMVWLLSIVVLPFPTEIVGGSHTRVSDRVFYVGTLLMSSVMLSGIHQLAISRPELRRRDMSAEDERALYSPVWVTPAVAFGCVFTPLSFWGLLLLVVDDQIAKVVVHWREAHGRQRGPSTG